MITTFLTREWGLRHPILNASMTPAATGRLARAVSDAGGLGMLGVNEDWNPADLARECAAAREGDPGRRFGIGFIGWALQANPALLDAAIAERPFLISISFVDPAPYAAAIHAAGIRLSAQVQSRADAELALAAGVDLLVAQGTEAGGHTGDVSTLLMLQIALGLSSVPVIAAGGIATPAGLAAVLAAGAEGAWVGTPFLLAPEASVPDGARARIAAARETDTVLTSLYDRLQGYPWPERFRGRALRNDFTGRWHGKEDAALADPAVAAEFAQAKRDGRYEVANVYAGQSSGLISRGIPAAEIVASLSTGAEAILRERFGTLLADP
ncbi:MAG: nitronate monooxygenase [Candidatus Eremiobacteraeota bacterium]|nr:nitronate monooxygenase [Candidatus Eremiobacteraeota bacterium]